MASLYADDDVVARALLKVAIAAETYLATDAVEGSSLSCTTYSDGTW